MTRTTAALPPTTQRTIVSFDPQDAQNPYNWPSARKTYVLIICLVLVFNSTIGSSLSAGATAQIQEQFQITDDVLLTLIVSIYLLGYVLGPLVFAPLSEHHGRKVVVLGTFALFSAGQLGSALTSSFAGFLCLRLVAGIGASVPVSIIGGVYADIYGSAKARGRAMTLFVSVCTWGPLLGPIISSYTAQYSWRWPFLTGTIIAAATWPFLLVLPETYGPKILEKRAKELRQQGHTQVYAHAEHALSWRKFCTNVLARPMRLFLTEWIVLFSSLYIALVYAVFYLFFQAYPIIFGTIYGFDSREVSILYLPVGVGALIAGGVHLCWERYLEGKRAASVPPSWVHIEEYRRLPIALIGAPAFSVSLFWLGWTARQDFHWIVPTLSGIPFGIGYTLAFIALLNYMVDAYKNFAASAMGAASCVRSLFGVLLPFAAKPMYSVLGVAWACSVLGFISVSMGMVPFFFMRYGEKIRLNSRWCQELKRREDIATVSPLYA